MKTIILSLLLLTTNLIISQTTYIPDDNFEQALIDIGYDDVLDDYVLTDNINTVTYLYVSSKNITDLTGIEGFSSLSKLYCANNQLTSLDITQNLALTEFYCNNNQLTSLNVNQNVELTYLNCASNQLSSLNVNNNVALINLTCYNNQLTTLDLNLNTELLVLISFTNQLTSINLGQIPIFYLDCHSNQLTSLNVSQNTGLKTFNCYSNQLSSLDLSNNIALTYLSCHFNQLPSLDLSNNSLLTYLSCRSNQLTSLDVRNGNNTNITSFSAYYNSQLTCILVDDVTYSTNNWSQIDATSAFVADENACSALSIASETFNFNVYPNPTDSIVYVESTNTITNIQVYNDLGQLVITNKDLQKINLSNLNEGVYFIKIIDNQNQFKTLKIVKY